MEPFNAEKIASRGSEIAKRIIHALSVAREERKALRPGRADNDEAAALRIAFEARGYIFQVDVKSWKMTRGDTVSASSVSNLSLASRPLMLMEALAAAARAEWADRRGLLASGVDQTPLPGVRVMDVSTGLVGTLEASGGHYATLLSDPLPSSLPAWAWRAMPGAFEGDRVRLHTIMRSMALVGEEVCTPNPTWSTVVSVARESIVPFQEDEVAPQPFGL